MVNPYGFCDKENYKEKRPQLVFEVHAVVLVTIRVHLGALGVHKTATILCSCRSRTHSVDGVCGARGARRNDCAARRGRDARGACRNTARRRCRSDARRLRSLFVVSRNLAVEVCIVFATKLHLCFIICKSFKKNYDIYLSLWKIYANISVFSE